MKLSALLRVLNHAQATHGDIETVIILSGGRQSRKASDEGQMPVNLTAREIEIDISGPPAARELSICGTDVDADLLPEDFGEHQREDESDSEYDARTKH